MAHILRTSTRNAVSTLAKRGRSTTATSITLTTRTHSSMLLRQRSIATSNSILSYRLFTTTATPITAAVDSTASNASAAAAAASAPVVDEEPINPEEYARRQGFSDDADEFSGNAESEQPYRADDSDPSRTALRLRLLDASLPFVSEVGWSMECLRSGATSLGLSTASVGIVGNDGPAELVYHAMDKAQQGMREKMMERTKAGESDKSNAQ